MELPDANGDRWIVRTCENEKACVVVERYLRMNDGTFSVSCELHIPMSIVPKLVDAIWEEATNGTA